MSLPTLPTPNAYCLNDESDRYWRYSREQMQAYGQQCRAEAIEEAAMAAENGFKYALDGYQIADKIRSLK